MNWINQVITHYNEITKANPLVATLMIPIIGGIMFYLKDMPGKIWGFLVRSTTVTLKLNNAGWDGNVDAYNAFDRWFMASGFQKYSRNFFMFRQYKEDVFADEVYRPYRLGVGKGMHFFFYSGRFFWVQKGDLSSSGSERQKEEFTIKTFGWNSKVFEKLVDLFNEKKIDGNSITVHNYSSEGWSEQGKIINRDISTFCMNKQQKQDIVERIERFFASREWYRSKGLTYKLSFMFFGPPGTGKSSLSRLLACHFKRDIYALDLSILTNASLVKALSLIRPGSILLLEDVDQAGNSVRSRKKDEKSEPENTSQVLSVALPDFGALTMSGMLNAIDGIIGLDNVVIIMTTNHPEDLDEAIRRKARIDCEFLIDNLTPREILDYCIQMYELQDHYFEASPDMLAFLNSKLRLPGCEVECLFKENPDDPNMFLCSVERRYEELQNQVAN